MAGLGSLINRSGGQSPLKQWLARRAPIERVVSTLFHRIYYGLPERTWENTTWLGTPILKCPLDLWVYQELIARVRPDFIVETGTYMGASAHYMASVCELLGKGSVITVDVADLPGRPQHPRITYIAGSSTDATTLARINAQVSGTVLVILDSYHGRDHVLEELHAYSPLVTPGSYLIVEDTNINGHPVAPGWGPGPMEALEAFLPSHPEFSSDEDCEKFFLTFNPKGYLRRALPPA